VAPFTRFVWPHGDWVETAPPLEPCRRGVHACTLEYLPEWLERELWKIELDGERVEADGLVVAERGRLVERVEAWDDGAAREFARACAGRMHEHAQRDERFAPYAEMAAAVAESADPKFYALTPFVARHGAEHVSAGGWAEERACQAGWLAERLSLER
jgi:hypothetical protein